MQVDHDPDLIELSEMLCDWFDPAELASACVKAGVNAPPFDLERAHAPTGQILQLLEKLLEEQRLAKFVAICKEIHPSLSARIMATVVSGEWRPAGKVNPQVIQKINQRLEIGGQPYVIGQAPSYYTGWQPTSRETGCYFWQLESAPDYSLCESRPHWDTLRAVRQEVKGSAHFAYIGATRKWSELGMIYRDCIVLAPTTDPLGALRVEQTTDGNYGIGSEIIIAALLQLDARYGIDLLAAYDGSVDFLLRSLPEGEELTWFSRWFHDFAPDAADDYGSTLLDPDRLAQGITLWWD